MALKEENVMADVKLFQGKVTLEKLKSSVEEGDLSRELESLVVARDVLQRQIDERILQNRQQLLEADASYKARKTRKLAAYFAKFGLRIVSCVEKEQILPETKAALLLFRIKETALPIFKMLVAKNRKECSVDLNEINPNHRNTLLQLCEAFSKLGWIETKRTRQNLEIVRLNDREATNFWHGSWAEYVTRSLVVKALQNFANECKCRFDVFHDIKLAYYGSTGKNVDMQLDLVAQLNDRFYVFEMKTGKLCIDKWVDRARLFSADGRSRFITCCADERIPTWLFDPYMLIPLGNIEKRLPELLRQEVHGAE